MPLNETWSVFVRTSSTRDFPPNSSSEVQVQLSSTSLSLKLQIVVSWREKLEAFLDITAFIEQDSLNILKAAILFMNRQNVIQRLSFVKYSMYYHVKGLWFCIAICRLMQHAETNADNIICCNYCCNWSSLKLMRKICWWWHRWHSLVVYLNDVFYWILDVLL